MKVSIFASGSGGNASLVSCGDTHVLLDAGVSARRITAGLRAAGVEPGCLSAILVTHEHHDHNYRAGVALRQDGPANPFTITALPSFHDGCGGAKRGPNTIHLLEAQGLRVAHLGDIGAMPAPDVVERLQNLDAVLVPVGGFYTVGPKEAKEIVDALQARVVIPMHYRSDAFGFDVLAPVEDFLELDSHWMRYETDTLEIHENMRHSVAVLTYGG